MAERVRRGIGVTRRPTVTVLYVPGTNCQSETLRAFSRVGAKPALAFISDILSGASRLDSSDILCIPGGFSFGDHLGAGTIAGLLLRTRLSDQLARALQKPILCICNGFQIAVRAGWFGSDVVLTTNESGTFRNVPDQAHQVVDDNPSPWLTGLAGLTLRFPCAHAEGRFIRDKRVTHPTWQAALRYPQDANPDGSEDGTAGITAFDGLLFGLMNHPERSVNNVANLEIFANGVALARS